MEVCMSKKQKRYDVTLTENELKVVVEGLSQFKKQLKSKADKMRKAHGLNNKGRHTQRYNYTRTALRKFSSQLPQGEPKLKRTKSIKDSFWFDSVMVRDIAHLLSQCCKSPVVARIENDDLIVMVTFTCLMCYKKCKTATPRGIV